MTMTKPSAPSRTVRTVAGVLGAGFLVLGLVEIIAPAGFGASYGLAIADPAGITYVQAVGARNAVLGGLVVYVVLSGLRRPLVALFGGLSALSVMEFFITTAAAGPAAAVRYLIIAAALVGLGAWVAFSRRPGSRAKQ